MDERFMMYVHDLKDISGYILDVLTMKIKREFHQIDFSRVKPIQPSWDRKESPRYTFDSDAGGPATR